MVEEDSKAIGATSDLTTNKTSAPSNLIEPSTAYTGSKKVRIGGISGQMDEPVATNKHLHRKKVCKFEPATSYPLLITNNCAFSRKTAEFFVAQQAHLIENNEYEAMSPVDLNQKIDELILYDPSFSDAYFLKYLNYLRLKDYPSSLKALHDYFDRIMLAGSVSLAALNLSSLEYRFDNKENALFALKEAITSAHHEGDNACLQHCLSWLYKMDSFNNIGNMIRKNFLIKSACSRTISNELYVNILIFKRIITQDTKISI